MGLQRYQINRQSPVGYAQDPIGPWVAASEAQARIEELEAENARLREAQSVLATEVLAWRACPPDHFNKVWSQPSMSGKHRSEFRQAIIDAMEATDRYGLTQPQPVAGWRERCVVESRKHGCDVLSPSKMHYWNRLRNTWLDNHQRKHPTWGLYLTAASARAALAACPTPPPGVQA